MTRILAASFGVVLMVVCSVAQEKYVTIIRRNSAPEEFTYSRPKDKDEFPSSCSSFNGNSLSSSESTQDCTCKNANETFAYSNNKWSCVGPKLYAAQNISGSASCKLRFVNGEWFSTVSKEMPFTKINLISRENKQPVDCSIDWKASSSLSCDNRMVPISKAPSHRFYSNQLQYGLSFLNIPKEMEGRVIKIVIRCKKDSHPDTYHCLMFRFEGQIKCPFKHNIKWTTPNIVTSSLPSSIAKTETPTDVTVHPTTKVVSKNEKQNKGSSSNFPVPAIAGGIAAVLVTVIVIIVFLACRRKRMRKNEEFDNRVLDEQMHQDKKELPGNEFCPSNNLQPSCVVQTEDNTPVYEKIQNAKKYSELSSKDSAIVGPSPASPNPEYDSVWDCVKAEGPYQNIQNRPWNSENSDYAVPEGSLDETFSQNIWYDVPEREVGTLEHLSGTNHYDKAGDIISDDELDAVPRVDQQNDDESITANPLYGVV